MYAVIESGGKQYRVQLKQKLQVDRLLKEKGDSVAFDRVLLCGSGRDIKVGSPYLVDGKVIARVLFHGRHKKIKVLKFKRRKNYKKSLGHRQWFTAIEITAIGSHRVNA